MPAPTFWCFALPASYRRREQAPALRCAKRMRWLQLHPPHPPLKGHLPLKGKAFVLASCAACPGHLSHLMVTALPEGEPSRCSFIVPRAVPAAGWLQAAGASPRPTVCGVAFRAWCGMVAVTGGGGAGWGSGYDKIFIEKLCQGPLFRRGLPQFSCLVRAAFSCLLSQRMIYLCKDYVW